MGHQWSYVVCPMGYHLWTMVILIPLPWMLYKHPWAHLNLPCTIPWSHTLAHGPGLYLSHESLTWIHGSVQMPFDLSHGQCLLAHGPI
jgi:hypothetical protein